MADRTIQGGWRVSYMRSMLGRRLNADTVYREGFVVMAGVAIARDADVRHGSQTHSITGRMAC